MTLGLVACTTSTLFIGLKTQNKLFICLNLSKNQINKSYFKGILKVLTKISLIAHSVAQSLYWESEHVAESFSL